MIVGSAQLRAAPSSRWAEKRCLRPLRAKRTERSCSDRVPLFVVQMACTCDRSVIGTTRKELGSETQLDEIRLLSRQTSDLFFFRLLVGNSNNHGRQLEILKGWEGETREKLDKDRFRQGLGDVVESYQIMAKRLGVI